MLRAITVGEKYIECIEADDRPETVDYFTHLYARLTNTTIMRTAEQNP